MLLQMIIPTFFMERPVMYRERASRLYAVLPWVQAMEDVEIPWIVLQVRMQAAAPPRLCVAPLCQLRSDAPCGLHAAGQPACQCICLSTCTSCDLAHSSKQLMLQLWC